MQNVIFWNSLSYDYKYGGGKLIYLTLFFIHSETTLQGFIDRNVFFKFFIFTQEFKVSVFYREFGIVILKEV